jgi:hypothetical protein
MIDNPLRPLLDLYKDLANGPAVDLFISDGGGHRVNAIKRTLARSGVDAWAWEITDDGVIFRVERAQMTRARFVLLRSGVYVVEYVGEY